MNILLLTENFPPKVGGSGRWFWEIYSRLNGERFIVAAGSDSKDIEFDATHNIRCERWPLALGSWGISSFNSIKSYFRLFLLLKIAIKKYQIGVIHCGRGLPEGLLGWLSWKCLGTPYLCYVHGEELPTYHSSREYKLLSNLVYKNSHLVIVNSKNTKQSFIDHTGITDTVRVMNPGVDTSYFSPVNKSEGLLQKLRWSGRKVVLTVGRLQKRKGHDHMIMAMNRISECIPNALYAIAGDGEERNHLEELVDVENLGEHVQFLGKVSDEILLACYQQCDLFVLPNREVDGDFEGFGMVLVEAQSCGKPVIAGKSGGTSETLLPGETGLLVDATSPDEIADTVISLLADESRRTAMGRRAVEWVQSNFDWNVLVHQAERVFSELAGTR